jgi:CRISPR type III-associated protein (TIGR04423 family)
MENYKKLTEIDPEQKYEGYLWWSHATSPKVYQNQQLPEWPEGKSNPFIIEGQLYDKSNKKSFSIRFVDGNYLIQCFDLNKLKELECIKKEYLPNRFPEDINKLCFREFWRPVKDELCEGMNVLQPAETVFVGFNCKED